MLKKTWMTKKKNKYTDITCHDMYSNSSEGLWDKK